MRRAVFTVLICALATLVAAGAEARAAYRWQSLSGGAKGEDRHERGEGRAHERPGRPPHWPDGRPGHEDGWPPRGGDQGGDHPWPSGDEGFTVVPLPPSGVFLVTAVAGLAMYGRLARRRVSRLKAPESG